MRGAGNLGARFAVVAVGVGRLVRPRPVRGAGVVKPALAPLRLIARRHSDELLLELKVFRLTHWARLLAVGGL